MKKRVYLAGPEVFLRDADAVFRAKREICRRFGLEGVSPLESHLDSAPIALENLGRRISRSNERCMRSCDLAIANLTPFRSPSVDPGTAYELGFMRAMGKPVLGYTNVGGSLLDRTARCFAGGLRPRAPGQGMEDPDGLLVEDFDLIDNLMIDGAILAGGFQVVVIQAPPDERYSCLEGFEQCVRQAALALFEPRPAPKGLKARSAPGM